MVDEVQTHMKEMLEVGAIHPSQSPWCNAVILVHTKEVCTLHWLLETQCQNQERLLTASPDTGCHWKPSGSGILLLIGSKGRSLANSNGQSIKAVHCFCFWKPRIFQMQMYAIQAVQHPSHISEINAELPRRTEFNLLLNLFGWHDSLFKDGGGACAALAHCVWSLPET